ncbi:MAG: HD domain-containing protein [Sedimentisphaerales bacterium]|nr:HD domain-containing protein [Sedimentisphaerales bacterium]
MDMLETTTTNIELSQIRELKKVGSRIIKYGVNFTVFDTCGNLILFVDGDKFQSNIEQLSDLGKQILNQHKQRDGSSLKNEPVKNFCNENPVLGIVLESYCSEYKPYEAVGSVLIDLGNISDNHEYLTNEKQFEDMLIFIADSFLDRSKASGQIEMVSTELARVYEELVLLHKLSTNMRVTEADSNYLQMACDSLTEIVYVEGIAILLEKSVENEQRFVVAAGSGLIDIDEHISENLYSRLTDELNKGKEAMLDSEVDSPFKYEWPEDIKSLIAVPMCGKDKGDSGFTNRTQNGNYIIGFMVAINRIGKDDFDSTDVKLFDSVASSCAVFIENRRLFKDINELFFGSLKALTRSIDAKDNYTHGHSERVAFISRWIAEKLSEKGMLEDEQLHRVYLAGLLHDIGKIGIDETLLRKNGKLTDEEYARIKMHPAIGAGILQEIKQMRDIVPGVLCHHERMDGRGYPDGLHGDQFPTIGKIVGLADSFDAMTSKRTYRDAMSVEKALTEIEKGLGKQFDEKIGRVFLDSNVEQLWEILKDGFGEIYHGNAYTEYGTAAVGMLIK